MRNKAFWVWLLVLAVPAYSLIAVQVDTGSGTSIGGGGYDLGPFLYSWALIIFTAMWPLFALAAALIQRDRAASKRAFGLTAIGAATFAAVMHFYGNNLF
jgi:hypothetical protein